MGADEPRIVPFADLREFFDDLVRAAVRRQRLATRDDSLRYLVDLLAEFSRADRLDRSAAGEYLRLPFLALIRHAAIGDPREKLRFLIEFGDATLYLVGFFADSLRHGLVSAEEFVAAGGAAYGSAARLLDRQSGRTLAEMFGELSEKFARFVDVFTEVSEESLFPRDASLLHLYEHWVRTRSAWAATKLQRAGVLLAPDDADGDPS